MSKFKFSVESGLTSGAANDVMLSVAALQTVRGVTRCGGSEPSTYEVTLRKGTNSEEAKAQVRAIKGVVVDSIV